MLNFDYLCGNGKFLKAIEDLHISHVTCEKPKNRIKLTAIEVEDFHFMLFDFFVAI